METCTPACYAASQLSQFAHRNGRRGRPGVQIRSHGEASGYGGNTDALLGMNVGRVKPLTVNICRGVFPFRGLGLHAGVSQLLSPLAEAGKQEAAASTPRLGLHDGISHMSYGHKITMPSHRYNQRHQSHHRCPSTIVGQGSEHRVGRGSNNSDAAHGRGLRLKGTMLLNNSTSHASARILQHTIT